MSLRVASAFIVCLVFVLSAASCFAPRAAGADAPQISLVTDPSPGAPAAHGVQKIMAALRAANVSAEAVAKSAAAQGQTLIVAGRAAGSGPAAQLLTANQLQLPVGPEALLIRQLPGAAKPTLLIAGADDRGLMYAAWDVADRIGWSTSREQPLSAVRDTVERPDVPERALSIYTMHRAYWESRFYDEAYWARYLDLLAQNRFNTLVVIFGYENGGFLAPPYPYFFDVPEFPDVRMVGLTPEQQQRNLAALHRLIQMAHQRGLNFTVGIWDHIYRGGVQTGGVPGADDATKRPTPGLVWGVTEKNLTAYTCTALAKFLQLVPEIDAVQFRMHDESGLKHNEQEAFWRSVFEVMRKHAPHIRFDARAKGLPDSVIQAGLDLDVKLRITTKYWMEQMGLPFHPTHINVPNQFDRRHSYADLLRYPQRYQLHWRLWNGGTARILLWGDPDYARRFAASSHLYDGAGYEVNEPLATKMEAQPHDVAPFQLLNEPSRYYDWEFERYWHFFQVFGRLGYDPQTPAEVWQQEFRKRFGPAAAPHVERGLHRASQVLPRIVAACYPYGYFPMTRGWAEKQRLGDLPAYAKAEGSDIQQFASFGEEAQNLLNGRETAKRRPPETSRWFEQTAAEILNEVAAAEQVIGTRRSKEFDVTLVDLRILAHLARFHARRIPAAVSYCLFQQSQDVRALEVAIAHERNAIGAWRELVAAAGDVYAADLKMGVRGASLCGHWRDELAALESGLTKLERQRRDAPSQSGKAAAPVVEVAARDWPRPDVVHQPITAAPAGQPLTITARVRAAAGIKWVRLRYRSVNQHLDYQTLPLQLTGAPDEYQAVVPAAHIVPQWDFMYFLEIMDGAGHGTIYPDLNRETPYIVVRLQREANGGG